MVATPAIQETVSATYGEEIRLTYNEEPAPRADTTNIPHACSDGACDDAAKGPRKDGSKKIDDEAFGLLVLSVPARYQEKDRGTRASFGDAQRKADSEKLRWCLNGRHTGDDGTPSIMSVGI